MTSSALISIVDCRCCGALAQKYELDLNSPDVAPPPELAEMRLLLEMQDANVHRNCTSITRFLQCWDCGSYYYSNHYNDQGEDPMDRPSNHFSLRRYDPVSTLYFLRSIASGAENALPRPMGQLVKAFINGGDRITRIAGDASAAARLATLEAQSLQERYPALIESLRAQLAGPAPTWHIQRYLWESLLFHHVIRQNWEDIHGDLLTHSDPVVRLDAALLVISIGLGDAPVVDLLYTPSDVRQGMEMLIAQPQHSKAMVETLCEIARMETGDSWRFDHGFGKSHYTRWPLRQLALYGLSMAGNKGARALHFIPELLAMLHAQLHMTSTVAQVLQVYAARSRPAARQILDGLKLMNGTPHQNLPGNADIQQVLKACCKRLGKEVMSLR